MQHLFDDHDAIEWDSLRQRSWDLEQAACVRVSHVTNNIAVKKRNIHQIKKDPKVKTNRKLTIQSILCCILVHVLNTSHPFFVQFDKLIDGRYRFGAFFPSLNCWKISSNLLEQSATIEQVAYPSIYRRSLCLKRGNCCLLFSFSYHLSSLAFAFCLILQSQ